MFQGREEAEALDPVSHLEGWREIPLQALHARHDQWVAVEGQEAFLETLRRRYRDPGLVEFVQYEQTGAPHEHVGFGRMAADAKNRQAAFFRRCLVDTPPAGPRKPSGGTGNDLRCRDNPSV